MHQKNKIGILGCGWLGLPLAKKLIKKNFFVKGSTTSINKIDELKENDIDPYLIHIYKTKINGNILGFLEDVDTLIINFPPLKKIKNSYSKKIQQILNKVHISDVNNILFVSSTSVYGKNTGNICSETTPIPKSIVGHEILKSEEIVKNCSNSTILRLGGLIGLNRNPARSLSKKNNVDNPDIPINLIHLEDSIGIILSIIEKSAWGEEFIGVCNYHPSRKEFYNQQCRSLKINKISFSKINNSAGKKIYDKNISDKLNYKFIKPKL